MFVNFTKKEAEAIQRKLWSKKVKYPIHSVELVEILGSKMHKPQFVWIRLRARNGEILSQTEICGYQHGKEMLIRLAEQLDVNAYVKSGTKRKRLVLKA